MKYLAICSAALLVLDFTVPAVAAEGESSTWRRWAIVAAPELHAAGISDLLTAKLSEDDSIELVEREQLDLALRELDLAAHFGADDAGRRLQLGKLLKADALALLALRRNEDQLFLRLLVSDCRYGARLSEDVRPMPEGKPAGIADWAAVAIENTRSRFRNGITRLIAVPPFLSKNLTHEHDHWQAGYAALVANSLSRHPGVAVVEIEEARAIERELNLVGDSLQRAIVPLFVEGEFATSTNARDDNPQVRLSARIKDAQGVRSELAREGLSTEQVVDLLRDELPRRILELGRDETVAALSRPQQQRLLAERGAVFSAMGAFEHATALREAALLLAADDVDLRIALVLDYNRWQHVRGRENVARQLAAGRGLVLEGNRVDEQTWARTHAERLARFRMTAPHVEHLVRRRQVSPREANQIVTLVIRALTQNALVHENKFGQQDKQALEDFFWRVYPQFSRLDATLRQGTLREGLRIGSVGADRQTALKQYQDWTTQAITTLVETIPRCSAVGRTSDAYDDSRTLEHLFRFLMEVPQRELPLKGMARQTMLTMNQHIAAGRLPVGDVRAFYERLKASDPLLNAIYARCGLLALGVHGGAPPEPLQAEADDLLAYFARLNSRDPDVRLVGFAYRRELERLRDAIEQRAGAAAQHRPPPPVSPVPPSDPSPPISFTPTGVASPWSGLVRGHDSLDLLWSFDRVDVMTAPNEVRTVVELDVKQRSILVSDMIYSAHWDGENIWIATMKSGIVVVSPAGERLGHFHSETGLPPYDARQFSTQYVGSHGTSLLRKKPLRLQPVEPGKCLAIGQFGGNQRLWFAMIERDGDGGFKVDVIHTATKLYDKSEQSFADPETVFPLQWTILHSDPRSPGRRLLLAGRALRLPDVTWPPLAIDLDSRTVSILETSVPAGFEKFLPQLEMDGNLLAVRDGISRSGSLRILAPQRNGSSAAWVGRELVPASDPRLQGSYPAAFAHDGAVYNPGVHWWRVHGDGFTAEIINDRPLAAEHRFEFYGASAHYGIVAWNRGDQLYQVSFRASKPAELADRYPYVPGGRRERHHAAVEAIRRLGGQVGTEWGVAAYPPVRFQPPRWRTIVYLSKQWSGGDADLARLSDLFNLSELYVVQTNVGDEGLRQIARLEHLEELSLVQTKVTNYGIAQLKTHPKLSFCHLESPPTGPQLGDAAVAHLAQLPKLVALQLVGRGFTDAALSNLQDRRTVRELLLYDTGITPAGIATIKKSRPSLQVSSRGAN